jgi:hypothetical protein
MHVHWNREKYFICFVCFSMQFFWRECCFNLSFTKSQMNTGQKFESYTNHFQRQAGRNKLRCAFQNSIPAHTIKARQVASGLVQPTAGGSLPLFLLRRSISFRIFPHAHGASHHRSRGGATKVTDVSSTRH